MPSYLDPTESQAARLEGRKHQHRGPDRRGNKKRVNPYTAMKNWCRGRSAAIRLPFAIYFGFFLIVYLLSTEWAASADILNAQIHRMGHWVWNMIGDGAAEQVGGLFFQLFVPAIAFGIFARFFDYYGMAMCMGWISTAFLWNVPYIRSALDGSFPRSVKSLDEPVHDWGVMIGEGSGTEGIVEMAGVFYYFGALALGFSLYLAWNQLYFMWRLKERRQMIDRRLNKVVIKEL